MSLTTCDILTQPKGWACVQKLEGGANPLEAAGAMLDVLARLIIQPKTYEPNNTLGNIPAPFGYGKSFPTEQEFAQFGQHLNTLSMFYHGDNNPVCWNWSYENVNEGWANSAPIYELTVRWYGQWTPGRFVEFQAREYWCCLKWDSATGKPSRFLEDKFSELIPHAHKFTDWGVD